MSKPTSHLLLVTLVAQATAVTTELASQVADKMLNVTCKNSTGGAEDSPVIFQVTVSPTLADIMVGDSLVTAGVFGTDSFEVVGIYRADAVAVESIKPTTTKAVGSNRQERPMAV